MEKPIDFWLRKGKAVGETMPTERGANVNSAGGASFRFRKERLPPRMVLNREGRSYYKQQKQPAEASCLREESNPLFADQGTLYVVLYAVLDDDELTVAEHFYSLQRCNYFLEVG